MLPKPHRIADLQPMPDLEKAPRTKLPKDLALIRADHCTGCGACREVCRLDAIVTIEQHPDAPGLQAWCEVDWDRCTGCRLCVQVPRKRSEPYDLRVCPWGAIDIVPLRKLPDAVDRIGGPPQVAETNRRRLLESARRQVELARGD